MKYPGGQVVEEKWTENAGMWVEEVSPTERAITVATAWQVRLTSSPWPLRSRSSCDFVTLRFPSVTAAVGRVDPRLSLTFRLFSDQVGARLIRERLVAWLSAFFGALAQPLAGIGLHGVMSFAVTQRRAEIGVRMALGPRPPESCGSCWARPSV